MIARLFDPEKGTWVLLSFIAFFSVVVVVNTVFITTALSTHSGVVTDQPYEKGLAYNDILEAAKSQPSIVQFASYEEGVLRWSLVDDSGQPLDAEVHARIMRPVEDGQDFDIPMVRVALGVYEADLDLPMEGRWEAQLKAKWQSQQYRTRLSFIAK